MIVKTDTQNEFYTDERCFITELLNQAEFQQLSVARARVAPNTTTALHSLSVDELYYILAGRGAIEINGTIQKELEPGDLAVIKSGESQRITNTSDTDLLFLCICTPRFMPEVYTDLE